MHEQRQFTIGDHVRKKEGYEFDSIVVSVFLKNDGQYRLVCEDDRGLLHIFNQGQMEKVEVPTEPAVLVNECLKLVQHALVALLPTASTDGRASAIHTLGTVKTLLTTLEKGMTE
jgi:hypothetical protein